MSGIRNMRKSKVHPVDDYTSGGSTGYTSGSDAKRTVFDVLEEEKKTRKIRNYICSIRLCWTVFVTMLLIVMGICIIGVALYFFTQSARKTIKLSQNEIGIKVTKDIEDFLSKGPEAVDYFKDLVNVYGIGGEDSLNLVPRPENPNVLVVGSEWNFLKAVITYVKAKGLFNGRYAEYETNSQIS